MFVLKGRIRPVRDANGGIAAYTYDYFVKDHLGNVRMVLTEQSDTHNYVATMERGANGAVRSVENQLFSNLDASECATANVPGGYPTGGSLTNPNDYVAKVNGSTQKKGPALVLKVMAGDIVNAGVKSFYRSQGTAPVNGNVLNDILSTLAGGIVSSSGVTKGTQSDLSNPSSSPLLGALNAFRQDKNQDLPHKPKAYLNWILLDEQFKYVGTWPQSGANPVQAADEVKALTSGDINITKNGYLYIYVSNETENWDVFFDDLAITHHSGPLLEETHYYPFGLTMAGISSKALNFGEPGNKHKFNGIEQNNDFDLNLYDAFYRNLDPQIGRFWQIDPKLESAECISPFSSMSNNPILFSDPLGDSSIVDNYGNVIRYDRKDKDLRVFMKDGDKLTQIGELGKHINAEKIIQNLLARNSEYATHLSLEGWVNSVKQDAVWDYKDDFKGDKPTIFGIAWEFDQKANKDKSSDSHNFTSFSSNNMFFTSAADFGNFHAGYTGSYAAIPPAMQYRGAGIVEIYKNAQKDRTNYFQFINPLTYMVAPYEDKRADYYYNKQGIEQARKELLNKLQKFRTNNVSNSMHYRLW
jgi:RHS repeat-associated protein